MFRNDETCCHWFASLQKRIIYFGETNKAFGKYISLVITNLSCVSFVIIRYLIQILPLYIEITLPNRIVTPKIINTSCVLFTVIKSPYLFYQ